LQQQLTRNVVGEIPEQFYFRLRVQRSCIKFEGVSVDDLEARSLELRTQIIYQALIFFDCENARAFRQHQFGQSAKARANFDNKIFWRDLRLIDNPLGEITIVKKILAETLDRGYADFPQSRSHFRQLH